MKAKHTQRLACRSYAEHDTRHGVGQIIRFTCRWIVREAGNHANLFLFHEIIDGFLKWNSCSGYTFWIMPGSRTSRFCFMRRKGAGAMRRFAGERASQAMGALE